MSDPSGQLDVWYRRPVAQWVEAIGLDVAIRRR